MNSPDILKTTPQHCQKSRGDAIGQDEAAAEGWLRQEVGALRVEV